MSDVNWDLAPEGATELRLHGDDIAFVNEKDEAWCPVDKRWVMKAGLWQTIATRPQPRKTVEDAVEAFPDGIPNSYLDFAYIGFNEITKSFVFGTCNQWDSHEQFVCTREQFEACVAKRARSEPEWTHLTASGYECKIIQDTPDENGFIVVLDNIGTYRLHDYDSLKPIKPTITKAEAWDMVTTADAEQSISVGGVIGTYNITD